MSLQNLNSHIILFEKISKLFKPLFDKFRYLRNKDFPYYFENYTKHVTIYKNGNGIIINTADLVVTNIDDFNKIFRKLNIEDGKANIKFPSLEKMKSESKTNRFDNFGFWFYSEDKIISSIKEFYWSDTDTTKEDFKIKQNPKEMRWVFDFNKSKIQKMKKYKIIYMFSIVGCTQ